MNKLSKNKFNEVIKARVPGSSNDCVDALFLRIEKFKFVLESLPFIEEVAVCNNLSFGIANEDSDIDLFFVLNSKRFFLSRFLITGIFQLFGLRRHGNKVAGRFCLSFFVDEKNLNLSSLRVNENDYYFYFWFRSLIFLKRNSFIQSELINLNKSWSDLNGFSATSSNLVVKNNLTARFLEFVFGCKLFDWFELCLERFQLKRAKAKNLKLENPFGVVIRKGLLKFHVLDARREINRIIESTFL